jgi:hypothetical protein
MSLQSVLKRSCLHLLGAVLLFACSSENSNGSESSGTTVGGADGASSAGGTAASGGTTGSTGGIVESTGATGGGVATGVGGSTTGSGGRTTGSGGSGVTTGGSGTTTGGSSTTPGGSGTTPGGSSTTIGIGGGTETGSGGTETGSGGTETGGTGTSTCDTELPVLDNPLTPADFTETVAGMSFDMVYIPGGTFTLGCESGTCDPDTAPVEGVTVSSYHMMKKEMTTALREAVTGETLSGFGSGDWYDCVRFACELGKATGRAYRMQTEAEFEYAAKNHLSSLEQIDGTEEWAYNSWSSKHSTVLQDPVGAASGKHTQKTRRDKATGDNITGRLIRSIDGIGPSCRLVVSDEMDYPPEYVPSCQICRPDPGLEPINSFRDPRWITGSDAHWTAGAELGFGTMDLRVWEDGTARQGTTDGQWFTSNNIAFVFVPNSGDNISYQYIFLDGTQGSLLSEKGFMGGFIGRIAKEDADSVAEPTISSPKSGAELAAAAGDSYKMVDMVNIPESAKGQDPRLLTGADEGWFQNNINSGGTHNYRKDVDTEEFRFAVIDGGRVTMLANGAWFTVNNMFLRVTHSTGYTCDYLYALSSDGATFYHDSYMGYERADFRMFEKYSNTTGDFPSTCVDDSCSKQIPKGADPSFYATDKEKGQSTFVPAPCPEGGCL